MSQSFIDLIRRGAQKEVAEWVQDDPQIAVSRDAQGVSALMWSVYSGQVLMRDFLLSGIPDLDVFEAAAVGNCERLRSLLAEDPARVEAISSDGWPVLHLAAAFGTPAAVKLLLDSGADVHRTSINPMRNQALQAAVVLGKDPEIVRLLLEHGADASAVQSGGFRPLHSAAANGSLELVRMLLNAGADPTLVCDRGKPAAEYARERGHVEVVESLERKG